MDRHVNNNPKGAKLFTSKCKFLILNTKFNKVPIEITEKIDKPIQADGTCTYIILTVSPCK